MVDGVCVCVSKCVFMFAVCVRICVDGVFVCGGWIVCVWLEV